MRSVVLLVGLIASAVVGPRAGFVEGNHPQSSSVVAREASVGRAELARVFQGGDALTARWARLEDEQFGELPRYSGPAGLVVLREQAALNKDDLEWADPETRLVVEYDQGGRPVRIERWDIFGDYEYERLISWGDDARVSGTELWWRGRSGELIERSIVAERSGGGREVVTVDYRAGTTSVITMDSEGEVESFKREWSKTGESSLYRAVIGEDGQVCAVARVRPEGNEVVLRVYQSADGELWIEGMGAEGMAGRRYRRVRDDGEILHEVAYGANGASRLELRHCYDAEGQRVSQIAMRGKRVSSPGFGADYELGWLREIGFDEKGRMGHRRTLTLDDDLFGTNEVYEVFAYSGSFAGGWSERVESQLQPSGQLVARSRLLRSSR